MPKIDIPIKNYRPDLDGLRGIAVISVVLFHVFPSLVTGGFIGVDIFFVISGFLISGIMYKGIDSGSFRFSTFYANRIKRIFPALITVMLSCYLFGWFALLPDEFQALGKEMFGGAGFFANLLFWNETGYFDSAAFTKPLLHLWSLGVEEQFYFAWPILLILFWKRTRLLRLILLLGVLSFAVNLSYLHYDVSGSFYSPVSRFWELLAGALLAWLTRDNILAEWRGQFSAPSTLHILSLTGLALLLAPVFLFNQDRIQFPGWWAVFPVAGAWMAIQAGPSAWGNRVILSSRILVWIGLISYPLYLWHWPILSLARIILEQEPSTPVRVIIVATSIFLAWLTWRLIEIPIRFGRKNRSKIIILCVLMTFLGLIGHNTDIRDGLAFRLKNRISVSYESAQDQTVYPDCGLTGSKAPEFCSRSTTQTPPRYAILGDSHAKHLFPGLAARDGAQGWELLGNRCPPLTGINNSQAGGLTDCPQRTERIVHYLAASKSIGTVLLGFFPDYMLDSNFGADRKYDHWAQRVRLSSPHYPGASKQELFFHGLDNTISALEQAGKHVIIVIDVPQLPFFPRDCIRRPLFNIAPVCHLATDTVLQRQQPLRVILQRLQARHPALRQFDSVKAFCDQKSCHIMSNGMMYYHDSDHLNAQGSAYFARAFLDWYARGDH